MARSHYCRRHRAFKLSTLKSLKSMKKSIVAHSANIVSSIEPITVISAAVKEHVSPVMSSRLVLLQKEIVCESNKLRWLFIFEVDLYVDVEASISRLLHFIGRLFENLQKYNHYYFLLNKNKTVF